jgi:hypothetical protein
MLPELYELRDKSISDDRDTVTITPSLVVINRSQSMYTGNTPSTEYKPMKSFVNVVVRYFPSTMNRYRIQ